MEHKSPFISQTAKDYDMPYGQLEKHYNKYGATPMLYEMLELALLDRQNELPDMELDITEGGDHE